MNFIYFIKQLNAIYKFPQLFTEQSLKCGKCITEKELLINFSKHFGLK